MDSPMVIYAFLLFLSAALYSCTEQPHPTCSYSLTALGSYWLANTVECHKVDLDIPNNFNVHLIPEDVQAIHLSCPLAMPYGYDDNDYCNTLRQSCTPVPFRAGLLKVTLIGFQSDQGRLPVEKFLENVKAGLKWLYIHSSKVESLDADFMHGFQNLTLLQLRGNDIETLHVNTFESLLSSSGQAIASPGKPILREIVLKQNKLQQLDWSVFRPLEQCLVEIDFEQQRPGLKTLLLSGPRFNLSELRDVEFRDNKITAMPKEILQTIAIYPYFTIDLQKNNMCSKTDCSCCEMQDFMRWGHNYHAVAQRTRPGGEGVRIKFSCGNDEFGYNPPDYTLDRYQNCSIA